MLMAVRPIRSAEALASMREASRIALGALEMIGDFVRPGITTGELDALCHEHIVKAGARPACVGYRGYRHATCISVNHVVCHGVPGDKRLKGGDILNIDLVAEVGGMHGDTSAMFFAGPPSIAAKRLVEATQECLYIGMLQVRPGAFVGDIGAAIQARAQGRGYSVVRDFCGHGIGEAMHEEPNIPHYGKRGEGPRLLPGMSFTIEPMINQGKHQVSVLPDGWTAVTRDRTLSAQWEHTLLVTETGFEALTLRPSEVAGWEAFQAREAKG